MHALSYTYTHTITSTRHMPRAKSQIPFVDTWRKPACMFNEPKYHQFNKLRQYK